jgi:hypothetical protein
MLYTMVIIHEQRDVGALVGLAPLALHLLEQLQRLENTKARVHVSTQRRPTVSASLAHATVPLIILNHQGRNGNNKQAMISYIITIQ